MRRFPMELFLALTVLSCNSNLHFVGRPTTPAMSDASAIRAIMTGGAEGCEITISDPSLLPPAVRNASHLQVAFGSTLVTVVRQPNGTYTFVIPPGVTVAHDVDGMLTVVFVMERTNSQIVKLATGSPLTFGNPTILTTPGTGAIALGQYITLQANTEAASSQYDFTWSVSTSKNGPWQPIPGDGKVVKWLPLAAGNYFVNVSAVDQSTHRVYSTISPEPVVLVTDPEDLVTTEPVTGSIVRGCSVKLHFNAPEGLNTKGAVYSWSVGQSEQGPWSRIPGNGDTLTWTPTEAASYFVCVDVARTGATNTETFTTSLPVVFVRESQQLISASATTVERGVPTLLTLNVPEIGNGPFNWYFALLTGCPLAWLPAGTGGPTYRFVPTDVGSYVFRIDLPQPDGSIKSFVSQDPTLSVVETVPVVMANPESAPLGATVLLTTPVPCQDAPISWYYLCQDAVSRADGLSAPAWVVIDGIGPTIPFTPPVPGLYTFRVDVPQPDGTIKSFINTQPALTITSLAPIIQASKPVIERGDGVLITLNADIPPEIPIAWFYTDIQPSSLVSTCWTPLPGTGLPLPLVLPNAGSYYFRADVPGPNGTLQTYMSTNPVVSVLETIPVIQSRPANAIIKPGASVPLSLNASALAADDYRFDWSVGTSACGPWVPLDTCPKEKHPTWQVPTSQSPGAYFMRVIATQIGGPASYEFFSSGPVVSIVSP